MRKGRRLWRRPFRCLAIFGDQVYNPNAAKSCKAQPDRREVLVWISKGAKYPFTSPEDWRTRGWLLVRKVRRDGCVTANDRRVAMLLLKHQLASRSNHVELRSQLEDISYG